MSANQHKPGPSPGLCYLCRRTDRFVVSLLRRNNSPSLICGECATGTPGAQWGPTDLPDDGPRMDYFFETLANAWAAEPAR